MFILSDKFDAIIVGAGVAGSTAGYLLAKEGLDVLIIERGNYPGSKNMTGGRLYSHSLEKIIPDFAEKAPLERKITTEKISMITEDSLVTVDYQSEDLGARGTASYSVLRSKFDPWLAEQAEEAGAQIVPGIRVDDLLVKDGHVCGISAGGEEMESEVVILADGVNSLLAQKLGMRSELRPDQVAVGVKEIIELPKKTIEDRFNLSESEGVAWLFDGSASAGRIGGGFLYTNKSSLSLGIVCTLSDLSDSPVPLPQMMENFKIHKAIAPLIADGKTAEYSAHLVPEAGLNMVPRIVGNGVLVIGDAAGFCINIGYAVRGMDLAIGSAEAAAKAILYAKERKDYSETSLSKYKELLDQSFVMKDLKLYRKFPKFMENRRIFNDYPQLAADIMKDLFTIDGGETLPLRKKIMHEVKKAGLMNLMKDVFKGVRAL
ncbi:FAD-dependent oxidoreductase [Sporolactobacillus sp. CQH2019]|uniref:FAD-dependent oxidoreductase n=1 Tax=Sporolactobacillus sp. CQH2019 TaxID=3023512 RepID=UPI002367FED1|nr:FAD-dependent oxidoreductase [Sporolactobacillus sp. CQH2019]MDD9149187.1 FAD-dependent oxidoreductase [Sporolactobacillus sp. CQH2019]